MKLDITMSNNDAFRVVSDFLDFKGRNRKEKYIQNARHLFPPPNTLIPNAPIRRFAPLPQLIAIT